MQFRYRSEVIDIGDGLAVIDHDTTRHEVRYAEAVIGTNAFARHLHPTTDVGPARGQILVTRPCQLPTTPVLGFLDEGHDYFRFVDGRLLVGGGRHHFGATEATDEIRTTEPVQRYLVALARRIAGPVDIEVEHRWAGIMGLPGGTHGSARALETPVALDARTAIVAGFGGWGVTLAPYVAQRLSRRSI